jgi:hypothetical protein
LILASWILLYLAPETYVNISKQNNLVEYLTAIFLLLTGIRLSFYKWEKGKRILPILLGITLIVAAFEELNWGKSFTHSNYPTIVDYIGRWSVEYILDTALLFLVVIMSYLYFMKKRNILDYRLPDFSLLLMFLITAFYRPYDTIWGFYLLLLLPLFLLFYVAYRDKNKTQLIKCSVALIMILGTYILNSSLLEIRNIPANHLTQFKELLFSFITLAYSIFIVKEDKMPTPFEGKEHNYN